MDDIRGLKPFLYFAPNWKLVLLVGLLVLAGLALATWLMRRRPAEEAPEAAPSAPPPRPVMARSAREQLDELKGQRLIESAQVKPFHAGLSAIIRGFLGARFNLPGRRLTTTELLSALERQAIDPALYALVADFLPECDLVKFADATPGREEMEARLATAYYLVERLGDAPDQEEPEALEGPTAPGPDGAEGGRLDVVG